MMDQADQSKLEDILQEYFETVDTPNHTVLMEWIRRYPEYRAELTEFTVAWSQLEKLPPVEPLEVDETTLVLRGMSVVKNILYKMAGDNKSAHSDDTLFSSLILEAERIGLKLNQLAEQARLSVSIVRQLDLRQISSISIPSQAIETFAMLLHKSFETVSAYLRGPTQAIANASYKSDDVPLIAQQDFFEAVRTDRLIKEEDRQYWLSFKLADKGSGLQ